MSTSASSSAATDQTTGELGRIEDEPLLAVEIYYYGVDDPTTLPLTGANEAAAVTYFQRVKTDVIDAQRHSRRSLWITPFDRRQDPQRVRPLEIQRVMLVDCALAEDAVQETA